MIGNEEISYNFESKRELNSEDLIKFRKELRKNFSNNNYTNNINEMINLMVYKVENSEKFESEIEFQLSISKYPNNLIYLDIINKNSIEIIDSKYQSKNLSFEKKILKNILYFKAYNHKKFIKLLNYLISI